MKDKFLGKDPTDESIKWSEDQIQMYIVQESRRSGYCVTASMEKAKRNKVSGARAKAMGMTAGVPDLIYRLKHGVKKEIELKTKKGKLSLEQIKFHAELLKLEHNVYTVYAKTPMDGWIQTKDILSNN